MSTPVIDEVISTTGRLSFKQGAKVDIADLKRFCTAVNKDAKEVCLGIVGLLNKQGVKAQAKQATSDNWVILVGTERSETRELLEADPSITANITIAANTSDVPATINALNTFFGNWRAVGGLIATGAAFVAGSWLMTVIRRP